ncbi:hypothetical protein PFISCL1PPCAC_16146, partial [Pristionchus fissidentatus]
FASHNFICTGNCRVSHPHVPCIFRFLRETFSFWSSADLLKLLILLYGLLMERISIFFLLLLIFCCLHQL